MLKIAVGSDTPWGLGSGFPVCQVLFRLNEQFSENFFGMSVILTKEENALLFVENGPFLSYFGSLFSPPPPPPRPKKKFGQRENV